MGHLIQSKASQWGFGWYSKLKARKIWIFQISRLAHKGWWILRLPFGLQSPKNFIFINFRKNWKFFNFIMYTQNAPVFTCNPKFWNGIRFLTMSERIHPVDYQSKLGIFMLLRQVTVVDSTVITLVSYVHQGTSYSSMFLAHNVKNRFCSILVVKNFWK